MVESGSRRLESASRTFWCLVTILIGLSLSYFFFFNEDPIKPSELQRSAYLESGNWLGSETEAPRRYYRADFSLHFEPMSSWLAIAALDYEVYINGRSIAHNKFVLNPQLSFQGRLSDRSQLITDTKAVSMARSAAMMRQANDESFIAQVYDLTPYLKIGRNTIAIKTQGTFHNDLFIQGAILGQHSQERQRIDPHVFDWKFASLGSRVNDSEWYETSSSDRVAQWKNAVISDRNDVPYVLTDALIVARNSRVDIVAMDLDVSKPLHRYRLNTANEVLPNDWLQVYTTQGANIYYQGNYIGSLSPSSSSVSLLTIKDFAGRSLSDFEFELVVEPYSKVSKFGLHYESESEVFNTHNLVSTKMSNAAVTGYLDQPVSLVDFSKKLIRPARLSTSYAFSKGKWFLIGLILSLAVWAIIVSLRDRAETVGKKSISGKLASVALPVFIAFFGTIFVIELLRFRFQESDSIRFFIDPIYAETIAWLPFVVAFVVFLLSIAIHILGTSDSPETAHHPKRLRNQILVTVSLALIIVAGGFLRIAAVDIDSLQADENVSWDAARGILKEGVPKAVSGVLYTRSPLYHYALAGWLAVFGDTVVSARMFAFPFGMGAILLAFIIGKRVTGRSVVGLFCALLLAIDSWQIALSVLIRFYQQMQFFGLLGFLSLYLGFIERRRPVWQNLFFVFVTLATLSQEVFVTVYPAFAIAIFVFYRPFKVERDFGILIATGLTLAIVITDIGIFSVVCLTPHVFIGFTSGSIMALNIADIFSFSTTFFIGNNLTHLLYAFFGLLGLVAGGYRNKGYSIMLILVYGTVGTLTVLVLQVANRYSYGIYPYLVMSGFIGLYYASCQLSKLLRSLNHPTRKISLCVFWVLAGTVLFANLEFNKTLGAYNKTRLINQEEAIQFVDTMRLPGDQIMSVHPMPAAIYFGGIDYYLVGNVFFDELYFGREYVSDRWSGGQVVNTIDHLKGIFQREDRVWIILDDLELPKIGETLTDFIENSCTLRYEFLGGRVFLWSRADGQLQDAQTYDAFSNTF